MKIEYENKEKVITHESGHIVRYTKTDCENFKAMLLRKITQLQEMVADTDNDMTEIDKTAVVGGGR